MSDTPATTAPETASPEIPRTSPGALLKQARERAGLGPDDLAGQLKLAKGTLEALERDDFAALSEPVYVRGYYRKIAKLLPVSEAELIAAYDARGKPARSTPALQRIPLAGGVAAGTSQKYRGQGVAIAVVIAVVIGVLVLFADRQPTPRLAESEPAPVATAAAPVVESPADAPVEPPVAAAPAITPAPVPSAPSVSSVRPGAGTLTPEPAPAPAPSATPPVPAASKPLPGPAPAVGTPAAPADALALEFGDASFVRVEDSRGRTLAIGLVKAGEKPVLAGRPPYTVFLGNAQSVKVFFNGSPVNFTSHINQQNDTARFTVP